MHTKKPAEEQAPHATHPLDELGTRSVSPIDPDDAARWLLLADAALGQGASEDHVDETESLARKEQDAIKRRIRRVAEQVKRHSKAKQ